MWCEGNSQHLSDFPALQAAARDAIRSQCGTPLPTKARTGVVCTDLLHCAQAQRCFGSFACLMPSVGSSHTPNRARRRQAMQHARNTFNYTEILVCKTVLLIPYTLLCCLVHLPHRYLSCGCGRRPQRGRMASLLQPSFLIHHYRGPQTPQRHQRHRPDGDWGCPWRPLYCLQPSELIRGSSRLSIAAGECSSETRA